MSDQFEAKERRAITARAGVVAAGTLASRLLGAARDSVIAACFSLDGTDAFFVAFTIPNTLRVMLGEGAVSNAFIPVFSEIRAREGESRAKAFYAALSGSMLVVLALVTALGIIAAPVLVPLYAAGYQSDPAKFQTTVSLTRWVFPYIFFMGMAALGMGALNTLKRFFVPAFAPALLNVAMIAAPVAFVPLALSAGAPPIGGLAISALVGGILQVVAQFPALAKVDMLRWPRVNFADPGVRKALGLLAPLMLGVGVYQINIMLSRLFASYLPAGSQSFLYYGQRLVEIPQGMLALAIASATLPSLAEMRNRGEHDRAKEVFSYSVRLNLFIAVPASVALAVLAEPTCCVLFGRGAFGASEVVLTARSLVWMAAGVWAIATVRSVVQMFYAYNDTRTPVIGSALNLAVFAALSLALLAPMRHAGIAAATSIAAIVQLGALLFLLRRRIGSLPWKALSTSALRCILASAVMGFALYSIAQLGSWKLGGNNLTNIAVYLAALIGGLGIYLPVARLLRAPELNDLVNALSRSTRPKA
jgi:putative peptidoglycan lipid II flippase